MPATVVAGNWKMNTTLNEARTLAGGVRDLAVNAAGVEVILCPPAISLAAVRDMVSGSGVKVGAQNLHHEDSGAYTGEISAVMLNGVCQYVILGHSERRQLFGETDQQVNLKVKAAFSHGLKPIVCVGETLEQRESGQAARVISGQVGAALDGVAPVDINGLIVAYEPVWAIGTGQAATPEGAAEIMGGAISETLHSLYGSSSAAVPLLYGGSVNAGNIVDFAGQSCIHGALVGGASLQADSFMDIVRLAGETKGAGS
ncbi:MAG: triose-phosphate isomerase [Chloroflexota bacterium]|nr:triose-phosphate isomerase [Chloroflexota bacterium]